MTILRASSVLVSTTAWMETNNNNMLKKNKKKMERMSLLREDDKGLGRRQVYSRNVARAILETKERKKRTE